MVTAAMTQASIIAFWESGSSRPATETTAVRVRMIARKPIALGTQASSAARIVGDPW